jgi:hypothetical protein
MLTIYIYTTSINLLSESLSENMNTLLNTCPYQIAPNFGASIFNADPSGPDCGGLQIVANDIDIRIDEALSIATDTKVYTEFPALGHWYDSKRLYDYLTRNPTIKNQYSVLLAFYNNMTNNAIAQERLADLKLRELIESFALLSPAQKEGILGDADGINDDIDITEIQNENEQIINEIYVRMVRLGIDSLTEEDKEFITMLAPQCPYIGGSAVYKARTLNYFLEPGAMYDDMKVCNAVGVYKPSIISTGSNSSTSLITLENETLSQIKPMHSKLMQGDVSIYPNPANEYIDIIYKSDIDAVFKMYNAIGEIIFTQKLSKENTKQNIQFYNLANGIYHYEVEFANHLKSIGKISISN